LRFRNALIRDAAYEGLPYRRRRALHERVGTTIEARAGANPEEEMAVLAMHFHEAHRWDKAWTYCRQAGDRAMAIHAIAEASRFYELALTAGQRSRAVHAPELAEVYGRWSDALYLLGTYDDADRALRSAHRLVKREPIQDAPLAIKQAIIASRTGRFRSAALRVTRALRPLSGLRGREAGAARARLMVVMTGTRLYQNRRVESIDWARQAEREARRAGAKDALADAYRLLDLALWENGEVEKAVFSSRALALYEELDDLRSQAIVLNNMGILAYERSDWNEALALYRRTVEIMEMTGDRVNASLAKYNIAEILTDQGRLDEAEPLLRESLRVWRASGAEAEIAEARRELGKLFARRGEFEVARELLESAHADQIRDGKHGDALRTAVRLSELEVLAGDTKALARIEAATALAIRTEGGSMSLPILHRLEGWALIQAGQPAAGEARLVDALAAARGRGDVFEIVSLLDLLARLRGRGEDAGASLERERDTYMEQLGVVRMPSFSVEVERPPEPIA
jgi:tetratricopeptide (TPR) repeat protein